MIYLQLFLEFLKIGLFTIGGGYAMIPLVEETITKYGWLTTEQFNYMIGLCEVTPGPIALNMATFVGATNAGFLGGLVATIGVVIPSFVIICIIAALLAKVSNNKYVKGALKGTMPVAIGLIICATVMMAMQVFTPYTYENKVFNFSVDIQSIKVFGFVLLGYIIMWLIRRKKPGPIPTILMSIGVGLLINLIWK